MPEPRRLRIDSSDGSTGGSGTWMRDRKKAEKRYETASTMMAIGALRNWISAPPTDWPGELRDRPAAIEHRVRGDVLLALDDRDVLGAPRDVESHPERPGDKRRQEQLRQRQHAGNERYGDAPDDQRASQIRDDHEPPPSVDAVEPDSGR